MEVGREWAVSGPEMGRKWAGSGPTALRITSRDVDADDFYAASNACASASAAIL